MKLGIITQPNVVSIDYYRTLGFYPFFENLTVKRISFKEVDWHTVGDCDAVVVSRPSQPINMLHCEIVKACNCKLIVDYDDDLFHLPDVPQFKTMLSEESQKTIRECLKMADTVIVSTEKLKEVYGEYSGNIVVRPNMHNDKMFPFKPELNDSGKVGFRGTKRVHEWNITSHMEVFAQPFEWIFFGADMWLIKGKHIPEKPFLDYMVTFKKYAPSVLFKPLAEIPHNYTKSNCSWLEATWAGAVCVAPDWDEWRKPGIVNYKDPKDAVKKIRDLINDKSMRADFFRKSRNYIKENLLVSNVVFQSKDYKL